MRVGPAPRRLPGSRGRAGDRGLAYRLRFCALDHTLDDAELARLRLACIEAAEASLPARLRS